MGTGRRKYDIPAILALVTVVLAIACFRSAFRLQSDMPPEFLNVQLVAKDKRAAEEKIAKAYWNCAVKQVQWKYGYAHRLPDAPPEEFALKEAEVGAAARDQAVRKHYWQQLHTAWNVSSVWQTKWEFSFAAFRQSLQTGGEWWKELVRSVVGE